jgi:hypothetical protein
MTANVEAMDLRGTAAANPRWALWTGRVLTALPILMMLLSASMKISASPQAVQMFVEKFGYQQNMLLALAIVELACVALYAIPRTAMLGAILLTGYLGGAVATHVRVGDSSFIGPVIIGIVAWAGLFLRDERLRALIPLRRAVKAG